MIERAGLDQVIKVNRHRMIVFAAFAVLVQVTIISIALSWINGLRAEATDLRTAATSLEKLISKTTSEATSSSRSVPDYVFEKIESSRLIRQVTESASASDCTITSMQPGESSDRLSVNLWTVALSGDYNCVGRLIESLEQSEFIVAVGDVSLTRNRSGTAVDATVAINIWDPQ